MKTTNTNVLSEPYAKEMSEKLKALSDYTRLKILSILTQYEGILCVGELTDMLTKEQPTVSHHIKILKTNGFVSIRKIGLFAYYHVKKEKIAEVQSFLDLIK